MAQAAAVLLGRPALPLGEDVAATLALRVVSLLCDCEAAPLPLGLPEGELEAEEEWDAWAGAVPPALALASSGEAVTVEEADTQVLALTQMLAVARAEALDTGEALREAATVPLALLLGKGVALNDVLWMLVRLALELTLALPEARALTHALPVPAALPVRNLEAEAQGLGETVAQLLAGALVLALMLVLGCKDALAHELLLALLVRRAVWVRQEEWVPEAEVVTSSALPLGRVLLLALLWRLREALTLGQVLALRKALLEALLESSGEPLPLPQED